MAILGAHMSTAGGYYRAVEHAHAAGCDCVQLFTKNNSQWRAREILPEEANLTFGVRARRADKTFPLASPEVCRLLGAAIQKARGWGVDLNDPDVTVYVTFLGNRSFISCERLPGFGSIEGVRLSRPCRPGT